MTTTGTKTLLLTLCIGLALLGTGCASQRGADDAYGSAANDPLEPMNRAVFAFNRTIDGMLIKPVTTVYRGVVPQPGRQMVHNFLTNLSMPVVFVNSVAQANPEKAFTSLWRFLLNSTLGVGGLFDFASANTDLKRVNEDFGQTLGHWGMGSGPYVVLPIIGPANGRDTIGRVVDFFADPVNYYASDEVLWGRYGAMTIDARDQQGDTIDKIFSTSVDPYATIRSAYGQRRATEISR